MNSVLSPPRVRCRRGWHFNDRDVRTLGTVDNVNCTQVKFHECKKVRMSEERWPVRPLTRYLNSN